MPGSEIWIKFISKGFYNYKLKKYNQSLSTCYTGIYTIII